MPEIFLDKENARVYQHNTVTQLTYQFTSSEDALKGYKIIEKEINRCLGGRNKTPFYPEFAIEKCQKQGIQVMAY